MPGEVRGIDWMMGDTPRGFTAEEWSKAVAWIEKNGLELMEEAEEEGGRQRQVWVVDRWWGLSNVKRVVRLLAEKADA